MQSDNPKFKIFIFCAVILIFSFSFLHFSPQARAGLVPCGNEYNNEGTITNPCVWNDLLRLFKIIIDFTIYTLIFPISAAMIIIGGIFIMTAGSSTSRVGKGKEIITAAVVGLLIALLSWLIINTIINILAGDRLWYTLEPWK